MITPESTRVQVVNTPVAAPGTCVLCGTAGDGQRTFIDFGKQLDWYGAIYFCSECIREVSLAIGYIPVDGFDNLHNDYRKLQVSYDQLEDKYKVIKGAMGRLLSDSDTGSGDVGSAVPIVEEPTEFLKSIGDAAKRDPKTNEPDSVEGSDDLFDDSDLES